MASILIVDDTEVIANMLKDMLALSGYTDVHTFNGPKEAIDYINKNGRPTLIITDYNMQELTGPQLLININKQHPGTQGMIMTSDPRTAALDDDTRGFPILNKNDSRFFLEIEDIVSAAIKKLSA
jgi:DNA-binding NtrC family response regulator